MFKALLIPSLLLCFLACTATSPLEGPFRLTTEGVENTSIEGATLALYPVIFADGIRFDAGPCTVKGHKATCPASNIGFVHLEFTGEVINLRFEAENDCTLNGIGLEGHVFLKGATSWLSNGYQSLSQSGMIALGPKPDPEELQEDLLAMADHEALRDGRYHSWWYTLAGGGAENLVMGAIEAKVFKSWISLSEENGQIAIRAISGAVGEAIPMEAGDVIHADPWFIALGANSHELLERYATQIPTRSNPNILPQTGWNSWYELGDTVREEDIHANANAVRKLYDHYEISQSLRIVIDDGWQVAWGDWTPNEKFPSGLDGLAVDLKAENFMVGVWLAPLLVAEDSSVFKDHPEWLVKGATWGHPIHGSLHVLDITHPDAAKHLQDTISSVVSWGYDFLKIDFLAAGSLEGDHYEYVTGMQHLDRAMALIREAAGADVSLLAVIAPPITPFPYVDGWRLGNDIAYPNAGPRWPFIPNQLRSIGVRWPLCLYTYCDADPALLRELKKHEVESGAWVVALTGGAMFLSDDIANLDTERWTWGLSPELIALATSGQPARPQDQFPASPPDRLVSHLEDIGFKTSTQIAPTQWIFPDGTTVHFNISDEPIEVNGIQLSPHSSVNLAP